MSPANSVHQHLKDYDYIKSACERKMTWRWPCAAWQRWKYEKIRDALLNPRFIISVKQHFPPALWASGPQSPGPPANMSSRAAWMSPSVACSALSISSSSWIPMSLSCCIWDCQRPCKPNNQNTQRVWGLPNTSDTHQSPNAQTCSSFA